MPITVLMSIYHKETVENLEECLKSLRAQTLPAQELVLVEDGFISYELKNLISSYREVLNIKSIKLDSNKGLARALNEGLVFCSNDLIARMDTDDISVSSRFESQYKFMLSNPDIVASSGQIEEFDDYGKTIAIRRVPEDHENILLFSKSRNPLSHPAVIFRKSAVLAVGGYPLYYPEDHFLWVKLLLKGYRLGNLPQVLVRMRTGSEFIDRRGAVFLRGELRLLYFMFREKFIKLSDLLLFSLGRIAIRLSPPLLRRLAYLLLRGPR